VFSGYCNCGKNSEGDSFCAPFAGDLPATEYLATLRRYLARVNNNSCNNGRRFEHDCVKLVSSEAEYSDYVQTELFYSYFQSLVNNDVCVKQTYTLFYWNNAIALLALGVVYLI
jgi:hypothetical protein